VFAGAADVVATDGSTLRFEYAGNNLRLGINGEDSTYMVIKDDHIYMISNAAGRVMVFDANQAMVMVAGMAGTATPPMASSKVISLKNTGRKEKQANIEGEVYLLRYEDSEGQPKETELLLSDDGRAKAFRDAMSNFAQTMAKATGEDYKVASDDMLSKLESIDMGVLRYGNDMTVITIDDAPIDLGRFTLPAPPIDLSGLGALFGKEENLNKPTATSEEAQKALEKMFGTTSK